MSYDEMKGSCEPHFGRCAHAPQVLELRLRHKRVEDVKAKFPRTMTVEHNEGSVHAKFEAM